MTHFQIILLHHDRKLVHSVLDQFEDGMIAEHKKGGSKEFHVLQSKRKLAAFISDVSVLDNDVSQIIVDLAPPPLVIMNENYYANAAASDNYTLSFYDHFVEFDRTSLVHFASQNFKNCKFTKTVFIQLFDEKEATSLFNIHEAAQVYDFLTRLFGASFEKSHHIHLFAKHQRADIDGTNESEEDNNGVTTKLAAHPLIKYKSVKHESHQLTSCSSLRILGRLLSTIIHKNKVPPMMAMYSLISKIRLKLNVVREIRSCIDPMLLSSNQCIAELVEHILGTNEQQANSGLRLHF